MFELLLLINVSMEECEKCLNRFNLWINGWTLVWELWEYSLCNYCSKDFNEIEFRNEVWLSLTK